MDRKPPVSESPLPPRRVGRYLRARGIAAAFCAVLYPNLLFAVESPSALTATQHTVNRMDLAWIDQSLGEDGFRIERAPDNAGSPGTFLEIGSTGPDAATFADRGLPTEGAYWYRVRAFKGDSFSGYSNAVKVQASVGAPWTNFDTKQIIHGGLGLRWSPETTSVYGSTMNNGTVFLPDKKTVGGKIRIPVIMIDFEDYDPVVDEARPGDPSSTFPSYLPGSVAELQDYLDGLSGYWRDVSGGQVEVTYEVLGRFRSGDPGTYLQPRASYMYQNLPDTTWRMKSREVVQDLLRDAVANHGVQFANYDADGNGFIDGLVVVDEGKSLMGAKLSPGLVDNKWKDADGIWWILPGSIDKLVPDSDPNYELFMSQRIGLSYLVHLPERDYNDGSLFYYAGTWVHECGHMLLGYRDFYPSKFGVGPWALSGNHTANANVPSGWEKWLFARWISPTTITQSGTYQLKAQEIPDGSAYGDDPYLFLLPLNGNPNHFLAVEYRWFSEAGNTGSRWALADGRESGLQITEINLGVPYDSSDPVQVQRKIAPVLPTQSPYFAAWSPGETFSGTFGEDTVSISSAPASAGSIAVSVVLGSTNPAPIISAVSSLGISSNSATLSWTTDLPADSQVEYGLTEGYGSTSVVDPALTVSHAQTLSGLVAGKDYHFRVKSVSAAGKAAVSPDHTFTTSPAGPVVLNPGFEAGTSADADTWQEALKHKRVSGRKHSGSWSLTATGAGSTTTSVAVQKDTSYLMTAWIYQTKAANHSFVDLNGLPGQPLLLATEVGKWQKLESTWNSGSNTNLTIRCRREDTTTNAQVWFDDIQLVPLP